MSARTVCLLGALLVGTASTRPALPEEGSPLVLVEGRGILNLVIGRSTAAEIEQALGRPLEVQRATPTTHNYYYKQGLIFNVTENGVLNTVTAVAGFAGQTSKGVAIGDTREKVIQRYGNGLEEANHLLHPGIVFYFDANARVERMVLAEVKLPAGAVAVPPAASPPPAPGAVPGRIAYEYLVLPEAEVRNQALYNDDPLTAGLNRLGAEGWELISTQRVPGGRANVAGTAVELHTRFIFKRPK